MDGEGKFLGTAINEYKMIRMNIKKQNRVCELL